MPNNTYDAIVVGSGISGGWAAKELTRKGSKVLMLETGGEFVHVKYILNAGKESSDYLHRAERAQQIIKDGAVLKRVYPLNGANPNLWVKHSDSPYTEINVPMGFATLRRAKAIGNFTLRPWSFVKKKIIR